MADPSLAAILKELQNHSRELSAIHEGIAAQNSWRTFVSLPDLAKAVREYLLPLSSVLIALSSLALSYLVYRRDRGRLEVYVGIGEIWGGKHFQKLSDAIDIRIVNSGRRPVTPVLFGGDRRWGRVLQILGMFIRPFRNVRKSFLLDNATTREMLLRPLCEGERAGATIELPKFKDLLSVFATARTVYVTDTVGRKHKLRWRVMRQLRVDCKKYSV